MELLGLRRIDLNPFGEEDLLAFNDSVTRPYRAIDLTLLIREGTNQRVITLSFLVVQCKRTFKGTGDEFESVQLGENPARSVKIEFSLSPEVKSLLIDCLKENV